MYHETVSLRDVLKILRSSRQQATTTVAYAHLADNPAYMEALDNDVKNKLGRGIARTIEPSWATFTRDEYGLPQRSIETWVLTREQVDAIVMVLMKLAEKMNTFDVRIPIKGEFDVTPEFTKGR